MKRVIALIMVSALAISLGACDTAEEHALSFETHGGEAVESVTVEGGSTIDLPEPERDFYNFEGWYLDEAYTEPADFETYPDEDLTLHADWSFDETAYLDAINDANAGTDLKNVLSVRHEADLEETSDESVFLDTLLDQLPFDDYDAFQARMEDAAVATDTIDAAMNHFKDAETLSMDILFTEVGKTLEDTDLKTLYGHSVSDLTETLMEYGETLPRFNHQDLFDHYHASDTDRYETLLEMTETYAEANVAIADTDALLEALSTMEEGKTLHLDPGTYTSEESIAIDHANTTLLAANTDEATILDGRGMETVVSVSEDAEDAAFEGLTIQNFTRHAVESHAPNTTVSHSVIEAPGLLEFGVLSFHNESPEVRHTQFQTPINATEDAAFIHLVSDNARFVHNAFDGGNVVPTGVNVDASEDTLEGLAIEHNDFLNFKAQALAIETGDGAGLLDASIASNAFTNADLGMRFTGDGPGPDEATIESNTFESLRVYMDYEEDGFETSDAFLSDNTFEYDPHQESSAILPVEPIENALQGDSDTIAVMEGVVTETMEGAFYIEDGTGSIRIDSDQAVSNGERVLLAGTIQSDATSTRIDDVGTLDVVTASATAPEPLSMDAFELDSEAFLRRLVHHRMRIEPLEIEQYNGGEVSLLTEDSNKTVDLKVPGSIDMSSYEVGDLIGLDGVRLIYEDDRYLLSLTEADQIEHYSVPSYTMDTDLEKDEQAFVLKDETFPLDITFEAKNSDTASVDGRLEWVVHGPEGSSVTLSDDEHAMSEVEPMHYEDDGSFALTADSSLERTVAMTFSHPGIYRIEIRLYNDSEALISETVHAVEVESPYAWTPFENLADEYLLDDGEVPLYFEVKDGIPYVDIETFLRLLDGGDASGAIDLEPLTIIETDTGIEIVYEWEDEETGESGSEAIRFDFEENTATADSFDVFSAAQESTQTDFGEDLEIGDYELEEGDEVVFDFDDYNFELLTYEDDYLMPLHIANLFFSGSMYDVYYNKDMLYGVDTYQLMDGEVTDTLQDSSYSNETMPEDYRQATYDYLALSFDYFYGLKEDQGVDTYYDVFPETIAENGGRTHYKAIFDSVYGLDDLHTSYTMTGFYTPSYNPEVSISDFGPRSQEFYDANDTLNQKHVCAQQGPSYYDDDRVARVPIHGFDEDTPDAFKDMLDEVSEKGTVEEVIVDLSCNTGGVVGGMIQTLGYMTDESIPLYNINPTDGSSATYYYETEMEAYDFEWHVFSSPNTFSAGNMMVQIAKDMDVATIIGQDSAGGAASIKTNITPSGAIMMMSSTSVSADADYESTEMGIEVDEEIPLDLYFDEETILEAIE